MNLPNGWEWQGGDSGCAFFGTKYDMGGSLAGKHGLGGYTGTVDADEENWWVIIKPIESLRGEDPEYGYPVVTRSFDSEEEAFDSVPSIIQSLSQ